MSIRKNDEYYMQCALEDAQRAYDNQEVPIGAVVVDAQGTIIGRGCNAVEQEKTQTAHAEIYALQQAAASQNDWRLNECTLYVTLEPCMMCFSAARLSRVERIVYGATSPLFGFHLDKDNFITVYNLDFPVIQAGVEEEKCQHLLKMFFKKRREKK